MICYWQDVIVLRSIHVFPRRDLDMTRPVFIYLIAIALTTNAADMICGINEMVDDCPADCSYNYCPTSENQELQQSKSCRSISPKPCPKPVCQCIFNYRRAVNDTCIRVEDCPPFECSRPNEEYVPCPPACPSDSCAQATPDGRCPLPGVLLFVLRCTPTCRCVRGYWRLNGECVPYAQCPWK